MTAAAAPVEGEIFKEYAVVSTDRLGIILGVSFVVHAIVILTVGFTIANMENDELPPTLEVKLVQQKTEESPEDARYIANEDNTGGGTVDEPSTRSNPFLAPFQSEKANIAFRSGSPAYQEPVPNSLQVVTSDQARRDSISDEAEQEKKRLENNTSSIDELSVKLETLRDAVDRGMKELAERPKKEFVHTRTKNHPAAAYMQAVVAKIERYGNQNYPKELVKGEVIMSLEILRNGTVQDVKILETNAEPGTSEVILNDAAKLVIKHSSPFAPMAAGVTTADILVIVRTYKFHGQSFSSVETHRR